MKLAIFMGLFDMFATILVVAACTMGGKADDLAESEEQ